MNFTAYCPITGLSYKVITPEIFQEQTTKTYTWKVPSPFIELSFLFKILQKNPVMLDIETKTSMMMAAFYHLDAFSETDKTKIETKRERIKESIIFAEKEDSLGRFYYFFTIKQILESSPRLQKKITKISVAETSNIALNEVLENWHHLIWPLTLDQIIHAEELEVKKTRTKTKTIIPDAEILDDFLGIFKKEEKKTISQIIAEKKETNENKS